MSMDRSLVGSMPPNCLSLFSYTDLNLFFVGPVMTKFTIALREIGTYKEVLRSQVEHSCFLLWKHSFI
jgi:hypothetical protein